MYCDLTQDYLRSIIDYDAETGVFMWKRKPSNNVIMSRAAGNMQATGYRVIRIDGTLYKAHRLAWLHVYGEWPPEFIDHINGIKHDNRICNLRCVSHAENLQNQTRAHRGSKTGVLGVGMEGGRYIARISHQGQKIRLGSFTSIIEASAAYIAAKRRMHSASTL